MIVPVGMCMIGVSMGIVSAYSSYIVTSALPARDAQQSGGVQATSRNVGQAIGVAVCGMVMLTAVTMTVQDMASHDASLSQVHSRRWQIFPLFLISAIRVSQR